MSTAAATYVFGSCVIALMYRSAAWCSGLAGATTFEITAMQIVYFAAEKSVIFSMEQMVTVEY